MALASPALNTIHSSPRKKKSSSKKLKKAHDAHEKWLKTMGVDSSRKKTKEKKSLKLDPVQTNDKYKLSDTVGNGFQREKNTYTGTEIIGISTTHKSNLIPIRNKQQAIDASTMRRS